MNFKLGKTMDECGRESEPSFYIRSNTSPGWRLQMCNGEPIQIDADYQIEAPGVLLSISNKAFYTRIHMNPSDAIKLGEELVALGKSALPHDYDSWQEKRTMKDIAENHPELLKKTKDKLFREYAEAEFPELRK
jgi:hypothetical protein